ncbi:hypothetical protein HDV03_004638 [Kappamyces sp. JEL0829]|nr:hypothetical protein HDV03_004638 [Kappamyces sp. JEL0829]
MSLLYFLYSITSVLSPFAIEALINKIQGVEDSDYTKNLSGYVLATLYFVSQLSTTMLKQVYLAMERDLILASTRRLADALFQQSLRPNQVRSRGFIVQSNAGGHLVNLVDQDAPVVSKSISAVIPLFFLPLQILLVGYFTFSLLGRAFLWGLLGFALGLIVVFVTVLTYARYAKKYYQWSDERLQRIGECLSGIKYIKMTSSEDYLLNSIDAIRCKQLKSLSYTQLSIAVHIVFIIGASSAVIAIPIGLYSLQNQGKAAVLFTALTFLNIIRSAILEFLYSAENLTNAFVAYRRLDLYLGPKTEPKTGPTGLTKIPLRRDIDTLSQKHPLDTACSLASCSLAYERGKAHLVLEDVSFAIPHGKHFLVAGPNGSGKSTLIKALVGGVPEVSGSIVSTSRVSYCPQKPWILAGTIAYNITLEKDDNIDVEKMKLVARICCIEGDPSFPHGTDTVLTENSNTLSGGQAARVSLARCLYKDADLYLLDDPFAALDRNVSKQLVTKVLFEYLKDKAVLFASNNHDDFKHKGSFETILLQNRRCHLCTNSTSIDELFLSPLSPVKSQPLDQCDVFEDFNESEEEMEKGFIAKDVYWQYFKLGRVGKWTTVAAAVIFVILTIGYAASSIGVSVLAEHSSFAAYYLVLRLAIVVPNMVALAMIFRITQTASATLHKKALESVLKQKLAYFETTNIGRILNRFSADTHEFDVDMMEVLYNVYLYGSYLAAAVICLVYSSLLMIPGLLLAGYLVFRLYKIYQPAVIGLKRLTSVTKSKVSSHFNSVIEGRLTIATLAKTRPFVAKERELVEELILVQHRALTLNILIGTCLNLLNGLLTVLVSFIGVVDNNPAHASAIAVGLVAANMIGGTANEFLRILSTAETAFNSAERLLAYANLDHPHTGNVNGLSESKLEGSIEFKDVTFAYPKYPHKDVLSNATFSIGLGEKIGVCGKSGSGKSSILAVLLRLYDIKSGTVLLGGTDITTIPLKRYHDSIAVVSQKAFVISESIRSNLVFTGFAYDIEIWDMLKKVGLFELVQAMPNKLDTVIGRDLKLSEGYLQRLCIARELLKKCSILLLDEPSSSADDSVTALLSNLAKRYDTTTICISHNFEPIQDYQRLMILDKGTIQEFDSPGALKSNPCSQIHSIIKG